MTNASIKTLHFSLGPFGLLSLLVVAILGLLLQAPAAWADFFVAQATKGAVRLAQAEGSLWKGRAQVLIVPAAFKLGGDPSPSTESFQLVRSVSWRLTPGFNAVALNLSSNALEGPVTQAPLLFRFGSVVIPDGKLRLESFPMEQAGGALAFLKPQAALEVRWSGLSMPQTSEQKQGISLDIHQFVTGLSPIKPLGSYRVNLSNFGASTAQAARLSWSVESMQGSVISMSGSGTVSDMVRGQLQFKCHRQCEFVNGLLSAIGKKSGDVYEAKLGI
jgi:hypothetical protein